jgi:hypothetical protein
MSYRPQSVILTGINSSGIENYILHANSKRNLTGYTNGWICSIDEKVVFKASGRFDDGRL